MKTFDRPDFHPRAPLRAAPDLHTLWWWLHGWQSYHMGQSGTQIFRLFGYGTMWKCSLNCRYVSGLWSRTCRRCIDVVIICMCNIYCVIVLTCGRFFLSPLKAALYYWWHEKVEAEKILRMSCFTTFKEILFFFLCFDNQLQLYCDSIAVHLEHKAEVRFWW